MLAESEKDAPIQVLAVFLQSIPLEAGLKPRHFRKLTALFFGDVIVNGRSCSIRVSISLDPQSNL